MKRAGKDKYSRTAKFEGEAVKRKKEKGGEKGGRRRRRILETVVILIKI